MSDDNSGSSNWSMRGLKRWLKTAPETRDELIKLVQDSHRFLQPDTVDMLEGVLDLPATPVREIMTPRPQVIGLNKDDSIDDILDTFLESTHSRYPVFDSQDDDAVIGILLSKDLIPLLVNKVREKQPVSTSEVILQNVSTFNLRASLRQPVYINESARSDTLLRSLQRTQVHMAVVVDDFGHTVGVVTLEDLLEEIVGDIVDEHDTFAEDSDMNNILVHPEKSNTWLVQASTPIEDCNEILHTTFDDADVDTMGGLVMQQLGYVGDLENEKVSTEGWLITVNDAEDRLIKTLELTPLSAIDAEI